MIIARHHREIVAGVVAGIVLPGYQVVPIHALRDLVVIVFTSACLARLRGRTPIPSAPSPGSVTIITSRHGGATNSQPQHLNLERNESDKMQVNASSSQQPTAAIVRRRYDLTAVFPLAKPRSWLNVKFRCSMISALRSNFPTEPARGHTMGTPEHSPRMGCTHLNSRWRVLIFRVQLMSLEYN